jgi:uncharacterized protein YjbJ (UPF0337 family)
MNKSNATGVLDQAKGKVKQAVGEAFNNQELANEGAADQVKGHAKEAWGNVKDTAKDIGNRHAGDAEDTGHNVRNSMTSAAANAKESINRGLDDLKAKH